MLAYREPNTGMSLADGLAEYYREHAFLKRGDQLSAEAIEFFRCHDAVHVLYGCDTSLSQEAIVKLSSIFGTTAGFAVLKGYSLYESVDIYRDLKLRDVLATILAATVIVPRTLWRCAKQRKHWPWSEFDEHIETPLRDLRERFGIRVVQDVDGF
jgi:ubiquinone biosynthesis protein Coq4